MRLEGQIKLGYYATPPRITDLIRKRLEFIGPYAALDPCAGEGIALEQVCRETGAETYGIELEEKRLDACRTRLNHALLSSLEEARISNASFSLLWLNPPYDAQHETREEGEKKTVRKERLFLRRCLPFLASGGVLTFIVPRHIFDSDTIGYMAEHLNGLEIWEFPEPEKSQFGQAVAIGTKRNRRGSVKVMPGIMQEVPADRPRFKVLISNSVVQIFRTNRLDPRELLEQSPRSPLWDRFRTQTAEQEPRRPPLSLHGGHLGLLLAAGCADGIVGQGSDRHLVRGKTAKLQNTSAECTTNEETGSTTTVTTRRDKYVIALKILRPDGQILELR
jgi:hypothetical protein